MPGVFDFTRSKSIKTYFVLPRKRPEPCLNCGAEFSSTANAKYCQKAECRKIAKDRSRRRDKRRTHDKKNS